MPPTTRRGESPNGGNDLPTPQSFRELMAKVNRLQQTITTQQTLIDNLKKSSENARQDNPVAEDAPTQSTSDSNILRSLKAPPIPIFSGKSDERTTTKVRGFIYNVRKTGKLTNLTEEKLVELAECHLQDKAAAWIMRLEQNDAKPTTIDDLQTMMISEFVPHDERARAKVRLMNMELKTSIETHIEKFQDLIEICATPISEAYIYFFMSLPAVYKEEFTKRFPDQPANIQEAYNHARTLSRAKQWTKANSLSKSGKWDGPTGSNPKSGKKDNTKISWGPAKKGEGKLYRSQDRCCKCGVKGWSDPSHPCREDSAKRVANTADAPKE